MTGTALTWKIKPLRRLTQLMVLALLILVPWFSQNPADWSPSRIIQGQIPAPATLDISGDTWAFTVNGFELAHPLAFVDAWISAKIVYLPLLAAMLIPLAMTVLLGRVFCSWLCPVGFLLELNMHIRRLLARLGIGWNFSLGDYRYAILACSLAFGFILAAPVLSIIDPPHALGREIMSIITHRQASFTGAALLLVVFLADSLVSLRTCCAKLCPSGCGLGLLGRYRPLRIDMNQKKCVACGNCDAACPYQLAPMAGLAGEKQFDWTTCDNCGLCRDACPETAISYRFALPNNHKQEV